MPRTTVPALFDAFFADNRQRGSSLACERLGLQVFTFQVGAIDPPLLPMQWNRLERIGDHRASAAGHTTLCRA